MFISLRGMLAAGALLGALLLGLWRCGLEKKSAKGGDSPAPPTATSTATAATAGPGQPSDWDGASDWGSSVMSISDE